LARRFSASNHFREIVVEAGLVEPLPLGYRSTGKGRSGRREISELVFHSLRHSAVTMLKAAGVSDFIAREIVGHESAGGFAPIHPSYDGRQTRCHAAVAGRDRHLKKDSQSGAALRRRVPFLKLPSGSVNGFHAPD